MTFPCTSNSVHRRRRSGRGLERMRDEREMALGGSSEKEGKKGGSSVSEEVG